MSFRLWEMIGLMSPRHRNDVLQLVEKYRGKYPDLDRDLVRKLIRLDNPKLFGENNPSRATNLKALDRKLGESFKKEKNQIDSENSQEVKSVKSNRSDSKAERKKLEEEERRLAGCEESDLLAKFFPSLAPLKMLSDATRKEIADSRKQRKERL